MPIPKNKKKAFGVIMGSMINKGKSKEEAKAIAHKAMKNPKVTDKKLKLKKRKK